MRDELRISSWNPPPNYVSIDQASKAMGTTPSCLRIWQKRYSWPYCVRDPNTGYRYFSPMVIEEVRRFIRAGNPYAEIDGGTWTPTRAPRGATLSGMACYEGIVHADLLKAVQNDDRVTVRFYLASLGRMRPDERSMALRCIHDANKQLCNRFSDLLEAYIQR